MAPVAMWKPACAADQRELTPTFSVVSAVAGQILQALQAPLWYFSCPVRGNRSQSTSGSQKTQANAVYQKRCNVFFLFYEFHSFQEITCPIGFLVYKWSLMTLAVSPKFVNWNIKSYSCNIPRQNVLFIKQGGKTSQGWIEPSFNPATKRYYKIREGPSSCTLILRLSKSWIRVRQEMVLHGSRQWGWAEAWG